MSQPNPRDELETAFANYVVEEFGAAANNTDPHDLMNFEEWLNMRNNSDIKDTEGR